jgi:ABC-type dipeptide/oligopeptide/nickel transport system permease component
MARYIIARLLGLIVVLFVVSLLTFTLMHGVPGGPWKYGERPFTDEQLDALKKRYGLDKPLTEQYLTWLQGVLRFDSGKSFQHPDETVAGVIRRSWPVTFHLGLMTLILAFGIGLPLGIIAALKQNTWIDYVTTLISTVGFVTPHFVWAILFILLFSLNLKWLPTGGWEGPRYWIMPVIVYSLGPMSVVARYTRASVVEVTRADYIRTARAKGLREKQTVFRHMLRNAMIPMVTVFTPIIPDLITGSIFIEAIFRVPGLGRYWVTSTTQRDYPMIIGLMVLWCVLIAVTYLITDILYVLIDPRVRHR